MDEFIDDSLGQHAHSDSASETFAYHDEDSVDIYAGLEGSPDKNENTGKTCKRFSSSPMQSESMDLFEEIIVEERLKKEASYNEMKTKFDEARSQLQELVQKLQQLETQNVTLQAENTLLKKNLCSLIKTAKSEIGRKDAEINRLSERAGRGNPEQTYRRPQSNQHTSHATTGSSCKRGNCSASISESLCERGNYDVEVLAKHTRITPLSTTELSRTKDADVVNANIVNSRNSALAPLSYGHGCVPESQHLPSHRSLSPAITASCSGDKGKNNTELRSDSAMAPSTTESVRNLSEKRSSRHSNMRHNPSASEKSTSTKPKDRPLKHKSPPLRHTSSSQMSKAPAKDYSEDFLLERSRVCREKEGSTSSHRSQHNISSERPRVSSNHNREKTSARNYYKEEREKDRIKEGTNRESRSSRADKNREDYLRTEKERSRSSRESTSKSAKQKAMDRAPERQSDVRGSRAGVSAIRSDADSSHKKDHQKKSEGGERQTAVPVNASRKTKPITMSEEHTLKPIVKQTHEGDVNHSNKEALMECSSTKKTVDNGSVRMKVKSSEYDCENDWEKKKDDAKQEKNFIPSEELVMDVRPLSSGCKVIEENSPNRKLSFMETLNLTLSPVKKPNSCKKQNGESTEAGSSEKNNLGDTGEEFYVIDELEASVEESHVDDKTAVSPVDSSKLQVNLECCNKTSTEEGEISVPADTEVPSSSQADVLKADDEKGNVGYILPTSEVAKQVAVNIGKIITHVIPHEEPSHGTNSAYSDMAATNENDIATSVCTKKYTVSESCLDVGKCSANTAEPVSHTFTQTSKENGQGSILDTRTALFVCSGMLEDGPVSEIDSKIGTDKEMAPAESCVHLDSVSSTVNLEKLPSCPSSCVANVDVPDISNMETESAEELNSRVLLREQLNEVAKVSSTTKKDTVLQEKVVASSNETPPHLAKDCEPDSTENTENSSEPSSSTVLPQDEDSMMLTLKTIKLIPDAISPLTSPVRQVKKVQPPSPGKQTHIKSLSTDFQNVTLEADTSSKAVDVNKENKKPDCSIPTAENSPPCSIEQEELEEGEIVSESETDESPVTAKSPKTFKEGNKSKGVKNNHSPQTRLIKMASRRNSKDLQPQVVCNSTKAVANRSPPSKRRFKTVPPPDPKTLPPSSTAVEEIMNMFKVIRSQLRKKYMKLNKNFPKKTFSSVIEMSNLSFTDLVSSLNLHKLCDQECVVKAKLKKVIINVMNKIGNNGIVNRIFEQNSHNLKSKLWSFVEGQLDFLFKEIQTTLASSSTVFDGKPLLQRDHTESPSKTTKAKKKQEVSPCGTTAKTRVEKLSIVEAKKGPIISTPCPLRRPAYQTGLGSRGKNLKMSVEETNEDPGTSRSSEKIPQTSSEGMVTDKSVDRVNTFVHQLSHSGSIVDKAEFEILTEQQTSSLTFNLVSDSQMGDIFKSLLQGSDLLENSASLADNQSWLLGTPKKELSSERSLLTGMLTPTKFGTPSKLMAAWASISPCKFLSPNPKVQMPLNPAALDESCLLEIPSSPVSSRAPQPTSTSSLKTFSILAEDLAVSLTIPSPLKTDSHLSFLHPVNEEPVPTPEEVLSAHFSEDAVLDGEDATEHDIHLSLDTDNSSCESSAAGHTWESTEPKVFQIKPHVPMQAVVTERSNDHFIVKIRHTSTVSAIVPAPETGQMVFPNVAKAPTNPSAVEDPISPTGQDHQTTGELLMEKSGFKDLQTEKENMLSDKIDSCGTPGSKSHVDLPVMSAVSAEVKQGEDDVTKCSSKGEVGDLPQEIINGLIKKRKRKKHHIEPKPKRAKTEVIAGRQSKKKHAKKTKNNNHDAPSTRKKKNKASAPSPQLSPQSLSAKNVVRKRGEVVVTWTREEDRDILVELKMKGPSRNTFSALSEKLNKSPSQIAERFAQLMKLFKKKEKMDSS